MSLSEEVEDADESLPEELRYLNFVKAGLGNSIYLISVKDIYYFMSDDKYTKVRSKDKEALINIPLKELEKQLDVDYIFISSLANQGIPELKGKLWHMLNS